MKRKLPLNLEMFIEGAHQENGPWYVTTYRVADNTGAEVASLGLAGWADWDKQGGLLFARQGSLYRQSFGKSVPSPAVLLANFNGHQFAAIESPDMAQKL
ncbi:MAG TPA: hypothetical protein VK633_14790 [Verrucomicrobiae bacterium]|nr:hypothetical protein [Verrucomicrobiae bacterium]